MEREAMRLIISSTNEVSSDDKARDGTVVKENNHTMIVKWPGFNFAPTDRNAQLNSFVKTHYAVYRIESMSEPKENGPYGFGRVAQVERLLEWE
jgi:hypothetical protein